MCTHLDRPPPPRPRPAAVAAAAEPGCGGAPAAAHPPGPLLQAYLRARCGSVSGRSRRASSSRRLDTWPETIPPARLPHASCCRRCASVSPGEGPATSEGTSPAVSVLSALVGGSVCGCIVRVTAGGLGLRLGRLLLASPAAAGLRGGSTPGASFSCDGTGRQYSKLVTSERVLVSHLTHLPSHRRTPRLAWLARPARQPGTVAAKSESQPLRCRRGTAFRSAPSLLPAAASWPAALGPTGMVAGASSAPRATGASCSDCARRWGGSGGRPDRLRRRAREAESRRLRRSAGSSAWDSRCISVVVLLAGELPPGGWLGGVASCASAPAAAGVHATGQHC